MTPRTALIQALIQEALEKINRDYGHLPYHNAEHTRFVLEKSRELAADRNPPESERELLELAAACHDVIRDETSSADWLLERLTPSGLFNETEQKRLRIIIGATTIIDRAHGLTQSAEPGHELSQLLCDADLAALGSPWPVYEEKMNAYYRETHPNGTEADRRDYLKLQQKILSTHRYYTPEARARFCHLQENAERVKNL